MKTIIALGVLGLMGCASPSTQIMSSWKDPATTEVDFRKIAIIAAAEKPETRKEAEDTLTALIPRSAPTYSLFGLETLKNPAVARQLVQTEGFDGVVVMRLVEMTEDLTHVAASPYTDFNWNTYDWDSMSVVVKQRAAIMETRLYSVPANKLIWSAQSKTLEPGSLTKTLPGIVKAAGERLREDGLVTQK